MPFYQSGLFVVAAVTVTVIVLTLAYRWRLRVLRNLQADLSASAPSSSRRRTASWR